MITPEQKAKFDKQHLPYEPWDEVTKHNPDLMEKTLVFLHAIEVKFSGFPITASKAKELRYELEEVQRELKEMGK